MSEVPLPPGTLLVPATDWDITADGSVNATSALSERDGTRYVLGFTSTEMVVEAFGEAVSVVPVSVPLLARLLPPGTKVVVNPGTSMVAELDLLALLAGSGA